MLEECYPPICMRLLVKMLLTLTACPSSPTELSPSRKQRLRPRWPTCRSVEQVFLENPYKHESVPDPVGAHSCPPSCSSSAVRTAFLLLLHLPHLPCTLSADPTGLDVPTFRCEPHFFILHEVRAGTRQRCRVIMGDRSSPSQLPTGRSTHWAQRTLLFLAS